MTSRTILDAPTTRAGVVLDGRDRERHEDAPAVGPHPLGLEMVDPSPGLQAGDDLVLLRDAIGRDDERDVAADGLCGGVAEEALGGGVPALDDAVERLADDGVVGRFDDRRQQARGQELAAPARAPGAAAR